MPWQGGVATHVWRRVAEESHFVDAAAAAGEENRKLCPRRTTTPECCDHDAVGFLEPVHPNVTATVPRQRPPTPSSSSGRCREGTFDFVTPHRESTPRRERLRIPKPSSISKKKMQGTTSTMKDDSSEEAAELRSAEMPVEIAIRRFRYHCLLFA